MTRAAQNLYVTPTVICEFCSEETHYAVYETLGNERDFSPRCALHDFSESYSEVVQHRCIRRFVQSQLLEYGIVLNIERCTIEETGYKKPEDDRCSDLAWRFDYRSKTRNRVLYAVWSNDYLEFELLGLEQASL